MKILTFDTSSETMYVAISNNSDILADKIVETTEKSYNSAHLIPVIIGLVKSLNLTMQDIEAIGVNIGPGSFAGIRASATVAKVMAQQLDIPVVGVSSMEIYSLLNTTENKFGISDRQNCLSEVDFGFVKKNTLCLLDARRGKAYMAVYGKKIIEPSLIEYEKAVEYAKNNESFIICDKKMSEIFEDAKLECLNLSETKENLGIFLAKLTYKYLNTNMNKNKLQDPACQAESFKWRCLKPLYIQPPPISTPKVK